MEKMEVYKFQAEINQLLNIIINAMYSNKDIFIRELISNASDALDKVKYLSLSEGKEILGCETELYIKITMDDKTISIQDSGIGMTKAELIENLGTIAQSGTKRFFQHCKNKKDLNLIGQFGVGFYSSYLVGDKVTVISKHVNSDEVYQWESMANGSFTIKRINYCSDRGTKVIIHVKESEQSYLNIDKIKQLIITHSNFITYPIYLGSNEMNEKDYVKVNRQQPIWICNPREVTKEEYKNFYEDLTKTQDDYLDVIHFKTEGQVEFTTLLFIPAKAPKNMFQINRVYNDIKLYVKRVLITDNCIELIPEYLYFLHGVIDSDDLHLNISREILQQSTVMNRMKSHIVKKVIETLSQLSQNRPKYKLFYDQFSKNIKWGVYQDVIYQDKLACLLRFYSVNHQMEYISLMDYVKYMPATQEDIYFIAGESNQSLMESPFITALKKHNYDVLLLTDNIDEYVFQKLGSFEGHSLIDITRTGLDLNLLQDLEKSKRYTNLLKYIKVVLHDKVDKVIIATRELIVPCILTTDYHGYSANMERIMKAQATHLIQNMKSNKVFELNIHHKLISMLKKRYNNNHHDKVVKNIINLLYETALLNSGFVLEKSVSFTERIYKMLLIGLNDSIQYESVSIHSSKSEISDETDIMELPD